VFQQRAIQGFFVTFNHFFAMKKASVFVKTLALLGLGLPALAQTTPSQTKPASPPAARKAATSTSLSRKYEGPKVAKSTQKLGQKFIDKSYEDTSPGGALRIPVKKVAPDQK
jgi:hypothetical protein